MGIVEGDVVKVAYVTNYSGEGIRTLYAPSSIFSEGLTLDVLGRSEKRAPEYKTAVQAIDLMVSKDFEASNTQRRQNRERWEWTKVKVLMKKLRRQGYFLETADEAYLRKLVHST